MPAGGSAAGRGAAHIIAKLVEKAGVRRSVWAVERAGKTAVRDAEKAVVKDALKRGETRAPKEILHDLEAQAAKRLTEGDRAAIKAFHEGASEAEKSITPRIEKIGGDRLEGLPFRLKSEDSLTRKVAGDMADGRGVKSALDGVNDSVRYTMKFSPSEYEKGAADAMARMKGEGFEQLKTPKNAWGNETGYRGINSTWVDPSTGQRFEMQFHTDASLAAKEITHPIYDFTRLPGVDEDFKDALTGMQNSVFDKVPIPPGAADVR